MPLIDLRCDWSLQYAAETSQYDPALHAEIPARLPRLDGYLMGTSLAVLGCRRKQADWAGQADPWHTLGEMLARNAAEFSGRLLALPDDAARWRAEPEGSLCWGVLAVDGLEHLVRSTEDLDRLAGLFARGVRVFGHLSGDLGPAYLERLLELAPETGPRPALDLAGADADGIARALDWFEADPARSRRLPILHTQGETLGADPARRLRALGGTIGVRPVGSADALRASIEALAAMPFRGKEGHEGIGVSTDFLGLDEVPPELADVEKLANWLAQAFSPEVAQLLIVENARRLVLTTAGAI